MSYFSRAKSSPVIPSSGNENAPSITAQDEETVIYQPRCGPADKAKSTDGEERTHHRASSSKSDSAANRSVDEERQVSYISLGLPTFYVSFCLRKNPRIITDGV